MKKVCSKCKEEKDVGEFGVCNRNRDGLKYRCRKCRSKDKKEYYNNNREKIAEQGKEYNKKNKEVNKKYYEKYYKNNKEKIAEVSKKWWIKNRDKNLIKQKEYRKNNKDIVKASNKKWIENNKEHHYNYNKKWREENKEKLNKLKNINRNKKRKIDPLYKLTSNTRTAVCNSFNEKGYTKRSNTYKMICCSYNDLLNHLNNNKYGFISGEDKIDIDHIIPLSTAKTEDELIKLWHFSNLQLLPSRYNQHIKKTNKWNENHFEEWLKNNPT